MAFARDFKDLTVWQRAMQVATESARVCSAMRGPVSGELRSQALRAAISVAANIAEGHSRASRKEFLHFLSIARASLKELETHMMLAEAVGCVPEGRIGHVMALADEVSRMLSAMRKGLEARNASLTAQR